MINNKVKLKEEFSKSGIINAKSLINFLTKPVKKHKYVFSKKSYKQVDNFTSADKARYRKLKKVLGNKECEYGNYGILYSRAKAKYLFFKERQYLTEFCPNYLSENIEVTSKNIGKVYIGNVTLRFNYPINKDFSPCSDISLVEDIISHYRDISDYRDSNNYLLVRNKKVQSYKRDYYIVSERNSLGENIVPKIGKHFLRVPYYNAKKQKDGYCKYKHDQGMYGVDNCYSILAGININKLSQSKINGFLFETIKYSPLNDNLDNFWGFYSKCNVEKLVIKFTLYGSMDDYDITSTNKLLQKLGSCTSKPVFYERSSKTLYKFEQAKENEVVLTVVVQDVNLSFIFFPTQNSGYLAKHLKATPKKQGYPSLLPSNEEFQKIYIDTVRKKLCVLFMDDI